MAAREKQVNRQLSYGASFVALATTAALWWVGSTPQNVDRVLGRMTLSPHGFGYEVKVRCYACHVPEQGNPRSFGTSMNCTTSGCHGELSAPAPTDPEEIRLKFRSFAGLEKPTPAIEALQKMHREVATETCWSCHTEHKRREVRWPTGWTHERIVGGDPAHTRTERSLLDGAAASGEALAAGET
ncbi:MAG: hypothetical protein SF028_01915 [Candidatus Sumerlaeia bacterium]|nr:hypothetical protein [Candidatus Sumerlaeia bacterium]